MAEYYAHINGDTVDSVIVIDTATIQQAGGWPVNGVFKPLSEWKQTDVDTKLGVNEKGGTALRKNYACIGHKYDSLTDSFIAPKTFDSWTLDEAKGAYLPPKEFPKDGKEYKWDESKVDWVLIKDVKIDVINGI